MLARGSTLLTHEKGVVVSVRISVGEEGHDLPVLQNP